MAKTGKDEQGRKGLYCECGKFHLFGAYVMAHWTYSLIHTCDQCEAEHEVLRGKVTLLKKGKHLPKSDRGGMEAGQ